ncbi:hypothetical protein AC579_4182 [Pseudocercospora musae]|nr:hypothetical protein AC579_4182 [Pseudocercospora musae]
MKVKPTMTFSHPRIEHGLVLMLFLTALFWYILWGILHNGEVTMLVSVLLVIPVFILAIAIDTVAVRWDERRLRTESEGNGSDDLESQLKASVDEKAEGGYGTF